MCWV